MTDWEDCPDCVYGPEFWDDGVPSRFVDVMCDRCRAGNEKAMKLLSEARAALLCGKEQEKER